MDLYTREFEDELFARAGGAIGKKGGPRQIGSLPHKPPKWETRELEGELVARVLESGPSYGYSRPHRHRKYGVVRREDIDNLWERTDMNEPEGGLFARGYVSDYGLHPKKKKPLKQRDLSERTDMNEPEGELFARGYVSDYGLNPKKKKPLKQRDLWERMDMDELE